MMRIDPQLPAEQRKRLLIVQGALYRAELTHSQQVVAANLHSGALVKTVFSHVAGSGGQIARRMLSGDGLSSGKLAVVLPLLTEAYAMFGSGLLKRRLGRPALLASVALASAGGIWLWMNRSRTPAQDSADGSETPEEAQQPFDPFGEDLVPD